MLCLFVLQVVGIAEPAVRQGVVAIRAVDGIAAAMSSMGPSDGRHDFDLRDGENLCPVLRDDEGTHHGEAGRRHRRYEIEIPDGDDLGGLGSTMVLTRSSDVDPGIDVDDLPFEDAGAFTVPSPFPDPMWHAIPVSGAAGGVGARRSQRRRGAGVTVASGGAGQGAGAACGQLVQHPAWELGLAALAGAASGGAGAGAASGGAGAGACGAASTMVAGCTMWTEAAATTAAVASSAAATMACPRRWRKALESSRVGDEALDALPQAGGLRHGEHAGGRLLRALAKRSSSCA